MFVCVCCFVVLYFGFLFVVLLLSGVFFHRRLLFWGWTIWFIQVFYFVSIIAKTFLNNVLSRVFVNVSVWFTHYRIYTFIIGHFLFFSFLFCLNCLISLPLIENFLSLFSDAKILSFSGLGKVCDSGKMVFCSEKFRLSFYFGYFS